MTTQAKQINIKRMLLTTAILLTPILLLFGQESPKEEDYFRIRKVRTQ